MQHIIHNSSSWLTLGDVRKFETGKSYKFATIDRNFWDYIHHALENKRIVEGVPYQAFRFYRLLETVHTYTHRTGVSGEMQFYWDTGISQSFNFHVCHNEYWYPINSNGVLSCHECRRSWLTDCDHGVHHSKLPDSTFVGWRGHMIQFEKVVHFPDIIVENPVGFPLSIRIDGRSYNRLKKEKRLKKLFAAYTIQRKWLSIYWKKKFSIVMGELMALPGAQDFEAAKESFYCRVT